MDSEQGVDKERDEGSEGSQKQCPPIKNRQTNKWGAWEHNCTLAGLLDLTINGVGMSWLLAPWVIPPFARLVISIHLLN